MMPTASFLALGCVGASGIGVVLSALALRTAPERVTMSCALGAIALSCLCALVLAATYFPDGAPLSVVLYEWGPAGLGMRAAFLVDSLSVLMVGVVTVVSLLVHIYSIGYMHGDPGRARFFCYLALFTLAMLLLVLADNFLLLFLGWEGVGLASYLLIGFWYTRERACTASLKAFLINRVGDFGFLLGIGAVFAAVGSLDYASAFEATDRLAATDSPIAGLDLLTFLCLLLFIGAMGKSAQMPLHAWLPDSMEGPTPISAMIHAATMVTAGIFMVARLSPLYEGSDIALAVILAVGAVTALATGLLGLVSNDIKRVLAYSTLSQLGYMVAALGVSAYAASIFHLFTHAFFKALLFLAAGSVIIALHHEQDIRRMGGLARRLPWTSVCFAIGMLALIGMPGFAGFFSKETIIEAVGRSTIPGADIAVWLLLAGVVVTALYMLRLWSMAFAGPETDAVRTAQEPGWSVRTPLVILAAMTLVSPLAMESLLIDGMLDDALSVAAHHDTLAALAQGWDGILAWARHGITALPVLLLLVAFVLWFLRSLGSWVPASAASPIGAVLRKQYGFDALYERILPRATLAAGSWFARVTDLKWIDGGAVMGMAHLARRAAQVLRLAHTGLLNHYALGMMLGLVIAIAYLLLER